MLMRSICIIVVTFAMLLCSCSSPEEMIIGEWEVTSVEAGKVKSAPDAEYAAANEMMKGLRYRFGKDSLFINDNMVGTYEIDSSNITFVGSLKISEIYTFDVSRHDLSIENENIVIRMKKLRD